MKHIKLIPLAPLPYCSPVETVVPESCPASTKTTEQGARTAFGAFPGR